MENLKDDTIRNRFLIKLNNQLKNLEYQKESDEFKEISSQIEAIKKIDYDEIDEIIEKNEKGYDKFENKIRGKWLFITYNNEIILYKRFWKNDYLQKTKLGFVNYKK